MARPKIKFMIEFILKRVGINDNEWESSNGR